jgi:hypothetical protein
MADSEREDIVVEFIRKKRETIIVQFDDTPGQSI